MRVLAGNFNLLALLCTLCLGVAFQLDFSGLNHQIFLNFRSADFAVCLDTLLAHLPLRLNPLLAHQTLCFNLGGFGFAVALGQLRGNQS